MSMPIQSGEFGRALMGWEHQKNVFGAIALMGATTELGINIFRVGEELIVPAGFALAIGLGGAALAHRLQDRLYMAILSNK